MSRLDEIRSEYQAEINQYEYRIAEAKTQCQKFEEIRARHGKQHRELNDEIDAKRAHLKSLNEEIVSAEKQVKEKRDQFFDESKKLEDVKSTHRILVANIESGRNQTGKIEQEIVQAKEMRATIQESIKILDANAIEAENRSIGAIKNYEFNKKRAEEIKEHLESLNREIGDKRVEMDQFRFNADGQLSVLQEKRQEIQALSDTTRSESERLSKLSKLYESRESALKNMERDAGNRERKIQQDEARIQTEKARIRQAAKGILSSKDQKELERVLNGG